MIARVMIASLEVPNKTAFASDKTLGRRPPRRVRSVPGRVLLGALSVLLLTGVGAQAQTDSFPTKPPADLPVPRYQPPPIVRETLPNGLRVVIQENRRIPLVTAVLGVKAGASVVPPSQAGLDGAVVAMMSQGTRKYDKKQLSEAAKNLGGTISIQGERDYALIIGSALSKNVGPILNLMADALLEPKWPEAYLRAYVYTMARQAATEDDEADTRASSQLARALYGSHPYGATAPTKESVKAITLDAVKEFYQARYRPNGAVLTIVGDISAPDVLKKVETALGTWKRGATSNRPIPDITLKAGNRVTLVNRPGSVQSNVILGSIAPKAEGADAYALEVANAIFGGKSDSRIFANVRERLGYAYAIQSDVEFNALSTEFTVRVECRTNVTVPAIKEILAEADRMATRPVTPEELQAAKYFLAGKYVQMLESQATLTGELFDAEFSHKPADYLATYRDKVFAVTAEDVQRVASKYLLPGRAAIIVVGDTSGLADDIAGVGYIQKKDEE